jgi:hypothetical protein
MKRWQRSYFLSGIVGLLLLAGAVGISTSTVTTRQGLNFQVSTLEIPLYAKVLDFFHRHYQYEALAKQITGGLGSDQKRALAIFDWTRRNIRRTPEGWTVVDDHVLNIIIRGHGVGDQMADVFTTLSTYVGVPAFWRILTAPGSGKKLALSFARVEGKWVVFDVKNGLTFRNEQGALASVEEIAADPRLVERIAGALLYRGIPYQRYFEGFVSPRVPDVLRAEQQMPWPRLAVHLKQLLGAAPASKGTHP